MKPMTLDRALVATMGKETLKKKKERKEQEDKKRSTGTWINEDRTNEDATTEEILMNETVLVSTEWKRVVLKIRMATFNEPEEKQGNTEKVCNVKRMIILKKKEGLVGELNEKKGPLNPATKVM